MKKIAISLIVLLCMAMSATVFACDSVHQDMTSTSTAPTTVVAGTTAPAK